MRQEIINYEEKEIHYHGFLPDDYPKIRRYKGHCKRGH